MSKHRNDPRPPQAATADSTAAWVPYRVPTMAEIGQIEPNGLMVASTFAGAGGSSTGWAIAGYRVMWANEFHPPAAESYAANHPETILDRRDIRDITGAEIIDACGGRVPDVLDGSPPCQDFSMAGKRTRGWGEERSHGDGTHQRSDDLFGQYTRLVREMRPRVFVAENVRGLIAGAAKGQFKRIHAALTAEGYRVRAKLLDAQWLGVPQRRKRVIIIGVRDDLDRDPMFPVPLPYRYSMLDACPWLAGFDAVSSGMGFDAADRALHDLGEPSPTIPALDYHSDPTRWQLRYRAGTNRSASGRADPLDGPIGTVTTQGARGMHHSEMSLPRLVYDDHNFHRGHVDEITNPASTIAAAGIRGVGMTQALIDDGTGQRKLTIEEVKRFCSFPDDYVLTGKFADQWARLGNSVPPLMMAAVGRALVPVLIDADTGTT